MHYLVLREKGAALMGVGLKKRGRHLTRKSADGKATKSKKEEGR